MRKGFIFGVVLAIMFVIASFGFAQSEKPGFINVNVVKIKAVVVDLDKESRMITLKGPKGNLLVIKAGEEVRNFDQIDKGDDVNVRYYESVAVLVDKGTGDDLKRSTMDVVEVAPKGAKPAGTMVSIQEFTARVEKINYKKRTITLRGPEGNVVTFNVDPSVKDFKKVKKGDEINIRHTEAMAISVDKPEAK